MSKYFYFSNTYYHNQWGGRMERPHLILSRVIETHSLAHGLETISLDASTIIVFINAPCFDWQ